MRIAGPIAFLLLASTSFADPVHLQDGDHVAFTAIGHASVLNPDSANDVQNSAQTGSPESPARVWASSTDATSLAGSVLKATPSPHRQQTNSALQESVAAYEVQFSAPGSYKLYVRGSNNGTPGDGSSDSVWLSSALGEATPSANFSLPNTTGDLEWKAGATFTVGAGDVGAVRTFSLGVREPNARIDAFVFSTQTSLASTELDDIFGGEPPPPPPAGTFFVTSESEFNEALAEAMPGNTIIMRDGVWANAEIVFDGKLSANGSGGTSGSPITLRAETGGQVLLTGESLLRVAGNWLVVDGLVFQDGFSDSNDVVTLRTSSSNLAHNCRITNCAIVSYNPADSATSYKWVSVYGTNNRIDHCLFDGMDHAGVLLTVWPDAAGPPNATQIDNNHFRDHAPGTGNGFETIRIGTSDVSMLASNALVERNLFERCDGEIEIISNKSVGNVYRCNTFRENDGMLTLRHGTDCVVDGNFFFGENKPGSGGVRIVGPRHRVTNNYFQDLEGTDFRAAVSIMNGVPNSPLNRYLQSIDCTIAFNTVVNCRQAFAVGVESSEGDTTLPPVNVAFANNVLLGDGFGLIYYENAPLSIAYEGNFAFGGPLGIATPASGFRFDDPALAPGAGGWWRPAADGPVPGSAAGSWPDIPEDIEGQLRDDAPDAGADEVLEGGTSCGPLTEEDVGPLWARDPIIVSDSWLVR